MSFKLSYFYILSTYTFHTRFMDNETCVMIFVCTTQRTNLKLVAQVIKYIRSLDVEVDSK